MNRQAQYRRYRNRRLQYDKQLTGSYLRAFNEVLDKVGKQVINSADIQSIPSAKEIANMISPKIKQASMNVWNQGILYGLNDVEEAYGKALPIQKSDSITKLTTEEFAALGLGDDVRTLQNEALKKVTTVATSYREKMVSIFEKSIAAAESRPELIAGLMAGIDDLKNQNPYIATRIAQTETTRLFNGGSLKGYMKSTVVKKKGWSSNIMGNPRPAHLEANKQEVDTDKPFMVMGESMMYPGDPNGSAANVVNCHCGIYPVIRVGSVVEEETKPVNEAENIRQQIIKFEENRIQQFNDIQIKIDELWKNRDVAVKLEDKVLYNSINDKLKILYNKKIELKLGIAEKSREMLYINDGAKLKYIVEGRKKLPKVLTEGLTEFEKLVSKDITDKMKEVRISVQGKMRAKAGYSTMFIPYNEGIPGFLHESGHLIEHLIPDAKVKTTVFYNKRTVGKKLQGLFGKPNSIEKFKDGGFVDDYIGKYYASGNTEVLSMGLQLFYQNPVKLAKGDPEMFDLIYNILRGK